MPLSITETNLIIFIFGPVYSVAGIFSLQRLHKFVGQMWFWRQDCYWLWNFRSSVGSTCVNSIISKIRVYSSIMCINSNHVYLLVR